MAAPGYPAYDPLFSALAQAEALPSHALRTTESALAIPGEALGGLEQGLEARNAILQARYGPQLFMAQRQSALLDNYAKLADSVGPDRALQLMGPSMESVGIDTSKFGANPPSGGASGESSGYTPQQLLGMGKYGQTQLAMRQNLPYSQEQSRVINDPNATAEDLANAFPEGIPKEAQAAFQNVRSLQNQQNQFTADKQQQLNAKKEEIEKDFQNKNEALVNAQNAIQSALQLKKQSGTTGPLSGGVKSVLSNVSSGAIDNPTYQLNRNNELWRSQLQHAVQVNRFNPEEVNFIGGGALAQPGEPLQTSIDKANNAFQTIQKQQMQIMAEKNSRLAALGLPPQPMPNFQNTSVTTSTGPFNIGDNYNGHKILSVEQVQ